MRCEVHPVRPALTYNLQLQAGFVIDVPSNQFAGSGHSLNVLLRVTPEGHEPVYLGMSGSVTYAPVDKVNAEVRGSFVVGEGTYAAETLAKDDAGRACYGQWRFPAKLAGSERDLKVTIPPAAVREVDAAASSDEPGGLRIDRLTILVDAAAHSPRAALLNPETIRTLTDSVSSLLTELPARSVRLVVFNLDQQVVLLRKEPFLARDLPEMTRAFEQLQLAVVDYKTLQNRERADVLSDLVVHELHNPAPASAVILLGPRTHWQVDTALEAALPHSGVAPWFYLQYQMGWQAARVSGRGSVGQSVQTMGRGPRPVGDLSSATIPMVPMPPVDNIERLVHRLNGVTLVIRTPHELADAVHRMSAEIRTVNGPAAAPASAPPLPVTPVNKMPVPAPVEPAAPEDPVEVLARLRDRVMRQARSVPNHTCVETVLRDRYEPSAGRAAKSCDTLLAARKQPGNRLRLDVTDWLRLDVGVADGREIFSWVGAPKFEDADIDELFPGGSFGTGPFAAMLLSLFQSGNPHFILDGATSLEGRRVLEYSFRVPRDDSHYQVKSHQDWIVTGYTGALYVDPVTSDLVRFVIRSDELPPETEACEVATTLDYSRVPIRGFEYLLPVATRQRFIGRDGTEGENSVSFASCREFLGESTLTFGRRPSGTEYFVDPPPAATLPAGLPLAIEMTSSFAFGQAAAGDPIEGRLVEPLRDARTQKVLAPAGAKVTGRLTRVELKHSGSGEYTVALHWETLDAAGAAVPLNLKPDRHMESLKTVARGVLRQRGMEIELPPPNEERDAIFHFPGQLAGVRPGLRSAWTTAGER
ncbi:MAG: hypothetical protein P4L56_30210 [Candidatus Sulfopaludibacter sp.]|nr:hypothetical protein [Candidatus Sulfopaludibacter sp.]